MYIKGLNTFQFKSSSGKKSRKYNQITNKEVLNTSNKDQRLNGEDLDIHTLYIKRRYRYVSVR